MAAKLKFAALAASLVLAGCSAPWSNGSTEPTTVATAEATITRIVSTATPRPTPSVTPMPTPVAPSPTPTSVPSPMPQPIPAIQEGAVATCCGVFSWIDDRHLLVFDTPANGNQGAYNVDVTSGEHQFVSPLFGLTSSSGLIAFPDSTRGVTEIRHADGTVVSTIQNGGVLTWISPDGKKVVWLQDLGVPNTSSLVNRVVMLKVSDIDGANVKSLVRFEASAVFWTADSRHVVALGRAPGGTQSGVWSIDTNDGTNEVIASETYVRALTVSPDGRKMAYLVTFSGDTTKDGVWVSNVDGSNATHLNQDGAFRWAGDDNHLWFLALAAPGEGEDQLVRVDVTTDTSESPVTMGGRVLNGQWQVSPNGTVVAYWSESDRSAVVRSIAR